MSVSAKKSRYLIVLSIILAAAAFVRLWYISYAGGAIIIEPDSRGYYSAGNFFTDDLLHNFFNINRTPGYTMVTSLALSLSGLGHPEYLSDGFFRGTWFIIFGQTIFAVIGLVFLYELLVRAGIPEKFSLAFTGFTALNIYQFIWERAFLTTAIFITLVTVLVWLFVKLLERPTRGSGIAFVAVAAYAFLVRPAGLGIPYMLLLVVWLVHRTKKVFVLLALLLILFTAVPAGYSLMNTLLYNFHGIGINTEFALFGRILHYNIPVESAAVSEPDLYRKVVAYRAAGDNISIPWYFFVAYNNEIYHRMDDLHTFDTRVIAANFGEFTGTMLSDVPSMFASTDVADVLYRAPQGTSPAGIFFNLLAWVTERIQKISIVFLVLFPCTVWLFVRKQTKLRAFFLGIGLMELYQLVSTLVFGGPWDISSHMVTTQTYLFLFLFWWAGMIFSFIKRRVLRAGR